MAQPRNYRKDPLWGKPKEIPKSVGIPPLPAPADSLPSAKYKITVPQPMTPKVITPQPFYAPQQLAKPLQFFIVYDSLNRKWIEVGSGDVDNTARFLWSQYPRTHAVRPYYNEKGQWVQKNRMNVYEIYTLPPQLKRTPDPVWDFLRNIVP